MPLDGEKEKIPPGRCGDRSETGRLSVPISGDLRRSGGVQAGAGFIYRRGVPQMEWLDLLEFAAIATVGDVMKLQDENRILVKYGLKKDGADQKSRASQTGGEK